MALALPPLAARIDLEACLLGGQAFTWWPTAEGFAGVVHGTFLELAPARGTWTSTPERAPTFLDHYLGAQRTHPTALLEDPAVGDLARALEGLRLLDQDPWEGLVQFLLSAVNNVPRIQGSIARLCHTLGEPVGGRAHALPGPRALVDAGPERLRDLGLGFRAPRLWEAARAVSEGDLDLEALRGAPIEEARDRLMALDGVGPKVAECILCYGLARDDAFPVDRWVARACEERLGQVPTPEQARDRWGVRAAMAQQLLFHGARMGLIEGVQASAVARFTRWHPLVPEEAGVDG